MCGANPFDYLTELQKHATDLQQNPHQMPWSYRQCLEGNGAALHSLKFFQSDKKFAVSCCDCVDLAGGQAVGEQNGVDDEAAIAGEIVTM